MIWRRLLLLSSIAGLVLLVRMLVLACASGWETEYSRLFFFLPENTTNTSYSWWFRQTKYYPYERTPGLDTTIELTSDIRILCQEWNGLLGEKFPLEAVADVVFYKSRLVEGEIKLADTVHVEASEVLHTFRCKSQLYDYLLIAKELEQFQVDPYNVSEKELKEYEVQYKKLRKSLIDQLPQVKPNKALYEKYLYQLIRLGITYHETDAFFSYYEEFKKQQVSPVLQGWGRLYVLGILYNPEDSIGSMKNNRQLAEVLELSPGKAERCIEVFRAMKETDYILSEKDPVLKANMLSMQAFHDYRPQMESLRMITELHPANALLPDLVTREINKYEDHVYSGRLTGVEVLGHSVSDKEYQASFQLLIRILNTLSTNKKLEPGPQNFYTLALAHCLALSGQGDEALHLLKTVKPDTRAHQVQKLITELFILSEKDLSDVQNLNRMAEKITEISEKGRGAENVGRCVSTTLLKMHKTLMEKKQVAMAGLCLLRSSMFQVTDNYDNFNEYTWYELNATHTDFAELERILLKKDKNAMEKLLVMRVDLYNIYNSRAKVYLRESNLDSAIVYLDKLPEWFLAKKYNFLIETSVFFKNEKRTNKTMEIKEALLALNKKIKTAETIKDRNQKASEYFAIANAFFELSNRGQYCYATSYYSTNYAPNSLKNIKAKHPEAFYSFYFQAAPAFRYFAKAKELSTDKELSAAIQFWHMKAFDRIYQSTQTSAIPVDGWLEYLDNYGETDFYQTHSCPGIEEYRRKK